MRRLTKNHINELTYEIIGAAIEVHKQMGPGLLEKIYEACMIRELNLMNIKVKSQESIPIVYKGVELDIDIRFDLLVDDCIIVELKSVKEMIPLFDAQVISYANLKRVPKSILINFNCVNIFKEGQKTFVNELFYTLPDK